MHARLTTRILIAGAALFCTGLLALGSLRLALQRSDVANEREQSATFATIVLAEIDAVATEAQAGLRSYVVTGEDRFLTSYESAVARQPSAARNLNLGFAGDAGDAAAARAIETRVDRLFERELRPTLAVARRDREQAARIVADGESRREVEAIKHQTGQLLARQRQRASAAADRADNAAAWATGLSAAGVVLTLALFGMFAHFVARKVERPIEQVTDAAGRVRTGDLTARAPDEARHSSSETTALASAFDAATQSFETAHGALEEYTAQLEAQLETLREEHRQLLGREGLLNSILETTPHAVGVFDGLVLIEANGMMRDLLAEHGVETIVDHAGRASGAPEIDLMELNGSERAYQRQSSPIVMAEDQPVGTLVVVRDITSERNAERMRDEFFSVVSHELRAPLTAVIGYVEALEAIEPSADEGGGSELAEQRRHHLDVLTRNVGQLDRLVGDILTVTQIEAGRLTMRFEQSRLVPVVEAAVETARPHAENRGVELRLDVLSQPVINMDSGRVAEVIDNLLSNAIKFTPVGGRVDVTVTASQHKAEVRVSDTGHGIPEGDVEHLFDRFYRSEQTGDRLVEGLGLGLAIVKAIVEEHGGQIVVESEVGQGTTFRVTLPIEESASAETQT